MGYKEAIQRSHPYPGECPKDDCTESMPDMFGTDDSMPMSALRGEPYMVPQVPEESRNTPDAKKEEISGLTAFVVL